MRRLSAALLLLITAACASDGDISEHVDFCCGPKDARLETYALSMPTVPAFLLPAFRTQLVAALSAKGMREVDRSPDALVTMVYSAYFPDTARRYANDGFTDPMAVTGPRKFDARISIEITRVSDNAQVLRGTMSREHREWVGDYGHERAREAIRAAFDDLLKRLPTIRKGA
jgi:hypothetical protein